MRGRRRRRSRAPARRSGARCRPRSGIRAGSGRSLRSRTLVRRLVQDLQHDLLAGPLALGEIDARHRVFGELADETEAADVGIAEARRARRLVVPRRRGPENGRAAPAPRAAPRSGAPWSIFAPRQAGMRAGVRSRASSASGVMSAKQVDHRGKAVAAAEVAQPATPYVAARRVAEERPRRRRCPRNPPAGGRARRDRIRRSMANRNRS